MIREALLFVCSMEGLAVILASAEGEELLNFGVGRPPLLATNREQASQAQQE